MHIKKKKIRKSMAFLTALLLTGLLFGCAPEKEAGKGTEEVMEETEAPESEQTPVLEEVPEITEVPEQTSFTLFCRTEDGTPVPGTKAEVCNGAYCRSFTADENGRITYYGMPGESVDVTPAGAPEGYVFVSDRALIADKPEMEFEFILKEK